MAPRRPFRAPLFNEKEHFYCARVLSRARKVAAAAGRPVRPAAMVSSEEAAALAARCDYFEWHAALAHHAAAPLHERLCELEAAMPRLLVSAASPIAQPVVPSVGPTVGVAQASETAEEAAAPDDAILPAVVQSAGPRVAQSLEQHVVPIALAEAIETVGVDAATLESACSPDAGIAESR